MTNLQALVDKATTGSSLTREEARAALRQILTGDAPDEVIARLLTAMADRGETADELAGFAESMLALSIPVPFTPEERLSLVDTCGTGGAGDGTFNISTASALVAAAAGAKVAKHGNRAITSKCGSADVLEAMGIPVALTPQQSVECLRATGFTFLYAPALHPSMKRVQPIRRGIGRRTIFNLAGPLTNPAGADAQVMGVYSAEKIDVVAHALAMLGVGHALVVHGAGGLDELTLTGPSEVAEVRNGAVKKYHLQPEDTGLAPCTLADLQGADTAEGNAAILHQIFAGETGPRRDIVLLNAAAALLVSRLAPNLREGIVQCAVAIDSGAVAKTVIQLQEFGEQLFLQTPSSQIQ
ncbi:MAG: anthranilate phosphoribosyltransferase [Acidobacteriaceae bacterium]